MCKAEFFMFSFKSYCLSSVDVRVEFFCRIWFSDQKRSINGDLYNRKQRLFRSWPFNSDASEFAKFFQKVQVCSRLESRAVPRTVWCFQACVNTWRNLQFDGQETGLSHSLTASRSHIWSLFFGPCCKLAWFSNRTGTSVDDGARKSDTWLDQWQSGKLGTKSCVQSFLRAFPSPTDVPVLLLNQPIMDRSARGTNQWTSSFW